MENSNLPFENNSNETSRVADLLQTIDAFIDSCGIAGVAQTIHSAIHVVSEAMRADTMDKEAGLSLIYNLSELQVNFSRILEDRIAIQSLKGV